MGTVVIYNHHHPQERRNPTDNSASTKHSETVFRNSLKSQTAFDQAGLSQAQHLCFTLYQVRVAKTEARALRHFSLPTPAPSLQ